MPRTLVSGFLKILTNTSLVAEIRRDNRNVAVSLHDSGRGTGRIQWLSNRVAGFWSGPEPLILRRYCLDCASSDYVSELIRSIGEVLYKRRSGAKIHIRLGS